jgi:hypothetical protein
MKSIKRKRFENNTNKNVNKKLKNKSIDNDSDLRVIFDSEINNSSVKVILKLV